MSWKKELTPEINEIIIGYEHPLFYAFSILALLRKNNTVKVFVRKNKRFLCRFSRRDKSIEERWIEVFRFLSDYPAEVKMVSEKQEKELIEVTVV